MEGPPEVTMKPEDVEKLIDVLEEIRDLLVEINSRIPWNRFID